MTVVYPSFRGQNVDVVQKVASIFGDTTLLAVGIADDADPYEVAKAVSKYLKENKAVSFRLCFSHTRTIRVGWISSFFTARLSKRISKKQQPPSMGEIATLKMRHYEF